MVLAGSRSSTRRAAPRGHKSAGSSSPVHDPPPPLLPTSGNEGLALRSKRVRTATLTSAEHDIKRRRLSSNKTDEPQLRIPLPSRRVLAKTLSPIAPASAAVTARNATVQPNSPPTNSATRPNTATNNLSPLASPSSPSEKPQYDQIKSIEEKAKAAINGVDSVRKAEDRRKLRSEDGSSRSKTELAQYFPDFEEMLSLKPPDPEAITIKTKVVLVDDTPDFEPEPLKPDPFGAQKPLHNTQIVPLSGIFVSPQDDPLSQDVYLKIHGKAERHEKQIKNSDRERAQHEKYQLEKLLDDLRGPDWLRTLGITGITDSEKRRYEPKRRLFVRETQALIEKFKRWKEEEKRKKLEREQDLLDAAMEDMDEVDEGGSASGSEATAEGGTGSSTHAPDSSELDALASQQLIEEAKSASRPKPLPPRVVDMPPPKPFVSFFDKRYLRQAAVDGRQRGRTILAFGVPVPAFREVDFDLPDDVLTEEIIRKRQRLSRRNRRETGND